jgi:hypothetical protein
LSQDKEEERKGGGGGEWKGEGWIICVIKVPYSCEKVVVQSSNELRSRLRAFSFDEG